MRLRRWIAPALACALLLPIVAPAAPAAGADLHGYTEPLPPLNHGDGSLAMGFSVDLLRSLAQRAGLTLQVQVLPWPRAVAMAAADRQSVLFTLTRTAAREADYRWVGPIARRRIVLYRLADRPDVQARSLQDLPALRTAVARESATARSLIEQGLAAHLEPALNDEASMRMLLARRVDAVAMLDFAAAWHAARQGAGFPGLQALFVLDDRHEYYFGLHKDAPDEVVARLQRALDAARRDGDLEQLTRRYLQ